jgi:undecaprenyl-diphosphatase
MSFLEILILAIVQGITEFLPISSDGHLVVANALLEAMGKAPTKDFLEVSIVLHQGTLLAVLVYYRREILRLLTSDRRVIPMLLLASVPAAIVGIGIKKGLPDSMADNVLESVLLAGLMFPVSAALLVAASRKTPGTTRYQDVNWRQALAIGCAQSFAILPGASRSGSTIAAALGVGLDRESAATFSFLMAIPVIAGAGLLEGLEVLEAGATGTAPPVLALGFAVSFVVGLGALAALIRFVKRGQLGVFAYYLVPLGAAVVAWQLAR